MNQIAPSTVFTATIAPSGRTFLAPANQTLLQSAEQANTSGRQMVSSCRNGTCRTCMCRLIHGDVIYRIKWPGLSVEEKRDGFILPCVAYPVSDLVIHEALA